MAGPLRSFLPFGLKVILLFLCTWPAITQQQTAGPSVTTGNTARAASASAGQTGISTGPPDVHLDVPKLSVGRIDLDVEHLSANLNLNAQVANLVTLNAGVALSVQKVNITITDVEAQLVLDVRLGHLVDIVNRVFQSLDLNPLLINAVNDVSGIVNNVIGEVDSLLGTVTRGGSTLSFIVDNLGNIVQQVVQSAGQAPVSSIVGSYLQNMTSTGVDKTLSNGLVQKQYSYSPLNSLVDIVFNKAGQVVQATVEKKNGTASSA